MNFEKFIGERGIYIEDRTPCLVKITDVRIAENFTCFSLVSDGRLVKKYGTGNGFSVESCPFGEAWEISQNLDLLYVSRDYLDASLYGGWRLIVNQQAVHKFENRDSSWEENYFG